MGYRDLIFDLYGTLVDIHTEENSHVWENTAVFFGFYGAGYTGEELFAAFRREMDRRETQAGQNYECFPDIPIETVFDRLFLEKGVTGEDLGFRAAQVFRLLSLDYIRLYPGVEAALTELRQAGFRLWLLSNAQRSFTGYELRHLGLGEQLDGIWLSSDYGCRKPDRRFYRALLEEKGLKVQECLMIGNDLNTDIAGAKALGMATLYMHTNLTPPDQRAARPGLAPGEAPEGCRNYEYEGCDWADLSRRIRELACN